MFKKPLKVSTRNILGGKDKKSLKKELSVLFNSKSVEHFLETNEKINCEKMQGSKIVVYSTDTYPAIVDSTGKGAYFPTLYLAQAYPKLLEPVYINPGVSNFIFNGANLMWPGVKSPETLSEFKADDVRVIINDANKPIAIGAMGCNFADIKTNNLQGVAVYVLHMLDDKLWETGPKIPLEVVFSGEEKKVEEKKVEEKKVEDKNVEEKKGEDDEEDEEEDEDQLANLAALVKKGKKNEENEDEPIKKPTSKKEASKAETVAVKKSEPAAIKKEDPFSDEDKKKGKKGKAKNQKGKDKDEDVKEVKEKDKKEKDSKKDDKKGKEKESKKDKEKDNKKAAGKKKNKKEEENEENEEEEEEQKKEKEKEKEDEEEEEEDVEKETQDKTAAEPSIPLKIMDEYIFEAFMNALRMSVTEKDLPMDSSVFYANHMLLCKKESIMIDLKNSSYKKIGKFFQAMAKLNLIEYKEAKKGTSPQITKINRTHEKIEKWEPTIGKVGSKKVEEEKKTSDEKWPKVLIEEVYKPRDNLKQLFAEEKEKKPDNLYTHEEVKNFLNEYLKKNCKIEKKFIIMDPYLCSLFPPQKTEEVSEVKETKDVEKKEEGEGGEEGEAKKKPKRTVKYESPNQILKDDLFQRYDEYLLKWHRVTNLETKKSETKMGNFKGISITAEKAHNKNITKMTGLEQFCIDLNDLSSKFQLKFACSVSLHDLPGKNAGKEVVVHGNFLQDIIDFFCNECMIDRKYIVSLNKLEKKKK